MTVTAILFGGPRDGESYELELMAPSLLFPVRRNSIGCGRAEGEPLPPVYFEVIYDYTMRWDNDVCMYTYREK